MSVVGDGLTTSGRALPRFLAALARAGVAGAPEALVAGPLRIGACIDAEHLAAGAAGAARRVRQRELSARARPSGALHSR